MTDQNNQNPKKRKQIHLPYYDYSQNGAYYVTICTHDRKNLFGTVQYVGAHPRVRLSTAGVMIEDNLFLLEQKYDNIKIDYYCVMPNHVHFILILSDVNAGQSLHQIIQWYKTQTTNKYIKLVKAGILSPFDKHVWQRRYYEHIIRGEKDLFEIRKYIRDNPAKWFFDNFIAKQGVI